MQRLEGLENGLKQNVFHKHWNEYRALLEEIRNSLMFFFINRPLHLKVGQILCISCKIHTAHGCGFILWRS